ncbi:MAG: sce7726 family protein [Pseudomonadota bacterium]
MLEIDIKQALESYLYSPQSGEKEQLFLDELRLCGGAARADLVNVEAMHCYEIKSEKDSLKRLVNQGSRYIRVFDKITLVTAETHLDLALKIIPSWWGVILVPKSVDDPFVEMRQAGNNPKLVPSQLAKLLTKQECLDALSDEGLVRGKKSLSLYRLQEVMEETLSLERLKEVVVKALQSRVRSLSAEAA